MEERDGFLGDEKPSKLADLVTKLESQPVRKILTLSPGEVAEYGPNLRQRLSHIFRRRFGRKALASRLQLDGSLDLQFRAQNRKNLAAKNGGSIRDSRRSARAQQIIDAIMAEPGATLQCIGNRFGISRERVRQIRERAAIEGVVFPPPPPPEPKPQYTWEPAPNDPDWKPIVGTDLFAHRDGVIRRKNQRSPFRGRKGKGCVTQVRLPDGRTIVRGRLIMEAFGVPQPSVKHQVWHRDRDGNNDRLSNLEWKTSTEIKMLGRRKMLPESTVRKIRKAEGSCSKIAERMGIIPAVVYNIRSGRSYKDVK